MRRIREGQGISEKRGWAPGSVWAVRTCLSSAVSGAGGCVPGRSGLTAPLKRRRQKALDRARISQDSSVGGGGMQCGILDLPADV